MKTYQILLTIIFCLQGCRTIHEPEHSAHFKLIEDQLFLVVDNKGPAPLKVASFGGHVYLWKNILDQNNNSGVAVSAPGFENGNSQVAKPGCSTMLKVPENMFRKPSEKEKTTVMMHYRSNGKDYHYQFELQGKSYIDENTLLNHMEPKKK